jgi:hypothetical protein
MLGLIRLILPWALLAVFLYRARVSRIFLLGIPFLLFMGESVFFDKLKLFHMPGRLDPNIIVTGWLVVVWVVASGRIGFGRRRDEGRPRTGKPARFLPEELAVLALGLVLFGHIVWLAVQTADFLTALGRGFDLLCMVVGYYLIRDIASQASRREVVSFLGTVVLANAVATGLFVVHQGLHVGLYTGEEYLTTTFAGKLITRSFYFAPRFVLLTLAFVLARRRWTVWWVAILLLTVAGVLVTYTRSLLLVVPVIFVLVLVTRALKRPDISRLLRRGLIALAVAVIAVAGFAAALPAEAGYFQQRLVGQGSSVKTDADLAVRVHYLTSTVAIVNRHDLLVGLGFPDAATEPTAAQVAMWGSDVAWIPVVYAAGLAGAVAFAAVFIAYGVRAFLLYWRGHGDREYLGLVYFATIVGTFILTGVSRVFMEPAALPVAFWLFAFVAAEARRPDDDQEAVLVTDRPQPS